MSERKVLNKYYPPDFDPSKIPRNRRPKDFQYKVRLMAPFSMRCNSCGEWIYKGKKFNARKEDFTGEFYLSIPIYRFYIRCPRCSAEISFKTDPKNEDYVCEAGASRNFEPWREQAEAEAASQREREEEEENNPMKHLENRTADTRREMEQLDALDEIRSINARHERVGIDAVLQLQETESADEAKQEELEDEKLVQAIFGRRKATTSNELAKRFLEEMAVEEIIEEVDSDELYEGSDSSSFVSTSRVSTPSTNSTSTTTTPKPTPKPAAVSVASTNVSSTESLKRKEGEVTVKPPEPKKTKMTASALGIVIKKKT